MTVRDKAMFTKLANELTKQKNKIELAKIGVKEDILEKLSTRQTINPKYQPFGDGHSAERIMDIILAWKNK